MTHPKLNGIKIEQYVINMLLNSGYDVDFIDGTYDLHVTDKTTNQIHCCEIKSCEQHIKDAHANAGYRNGRINIPIEQHEYMVYIDGYYILVMHTLDFVKAVRVVRAYDLKIAYHRSNIPWKLIFSPNENIINDSIHKYKICVDVELLL